MSAANPFDQAHELARDLQRSEAVSQLREAWDKVCPNPDQLRIVERFRDLSMELQRLQLGKKAGRSKGTRAEPAVGGDPFPPDAQRYMEAEHRLSQMMKDIYRMVNAPIEEIYKK